VVISKDGKGRTLYVGREIANHFRGSSLFTDKVASGGHLEETAPERMTQLLLEPARRSGCEDLPAVGELLKEAAQRQRSPIDDLLDAGVVDEENYLRELAHDLDLPWLASIPMDENTLPLL